MPAILCPSCKASNESGPACRRCKSDLSLLFQLEQRRIWLVDRCWTLIRQMRADEAHEHLSELRDLQPGADSERLQALAALAQRDFQTALAAWKHAQRVTSP
jgi:methylphosphotriester-DNA--protein-cysteine methyltransferase